MAADRALAEDNARLAAQVSGLSARVERLERLASRNSRNSSRAAAAVAGVHNYDAFPGLIHQLCAQHLLHDLADAAEPTPMPSGRVRSLTRCAS